VNSLSAWSGTNNRIPETPSVSNVSHQDARVTRIPKMNQSYRARPSQSDNASSYLFAIRRNLFPELLVVCGVTPIGASPENGSRSDSFDRTARSPSCRISSSTLWFRFRKVVTPYHQ